MAWVSRASPASTTIEQAWRSRSSTRRRSSAPRASSDGMGARSVAEVVVGDDEHAGAGADGVDPVGRRARRSPRRGPPVPPATGNVASSRVAGNTVRDGSSSDPTASG